MAQRSEITDWDATVAAVPAERVLYRIGPASLPPIGDLWGAVRNALLDPIGAPQWASALRPGGKVVILVDDVTRPTPQREILPALLSHLNEAGVPDGRITILIALGTHRCMSAGEIEARFGHDVCGRVRVLNHLWKDAGTFADLGPSPGGTRIKVNRMAFGADLLIGTGSIAPHIWAGWAGGNKIVLPGICSPEAIAPAHALAAESGGLLEVAGRSHIPFLREAEWAAQRVGLKLILNVVVNPAGGCIWAGAGAPSPTHKAGIAEAKKLFLRDVPGQADIVVLDARPAVEDYWQGIKALAHAVRGVREGGTIILVGGFPRGVAPTHPEFLRHGLRAEREIVEQWEAGRIQDAVIVTTLRLHALIRERCRVICLSRGLSPGDKESLGFRHAESPEQALEAAWKQQGASAGVGIIEYGGDVLPGVRPAEGRGG